MRKYFALFCRTKKKDHNNFFSSSLNVFDTFFLFFSWHLQDEKNQMVVSNIWLNLVSYFIIKKWQHSQKSAIRTLTKSDRTKPCSQMLSLFHVSGLDIGKYIDVNKILIRNKLIVLFFILLINFKFGLWSLISKPLSLQI